MIRRPQRSTQGVSSAASDVYKRQLMNLRGGKLDSRGRRGLELCADVCLQSVHLLIQSRGGRALRTSSPGQHGQRSSQLESGAIFSGRLILYFPPPPYKGLILPKFGCAAGAEFG
eukprot:4561262-Pyramimonas_sp.AAC.2